MFPEDQLYCVIDFETRSEANLKKVGGYEYTKHSTTEVLCVAWRAGTRKTLRTTPIRHTKSGLPFEIGSPKYIIVAHNAYFERMVLQNVYKLEIPPDQFICTAAMAAACALPRSLEKVSEALKLSVQKDMEGRRLMLKWSKPRKPSKHNPSTRHDDPEEYERLIDYCRKDVETETELFLALPPLSPQERKVWLLDQKINSNGFLVDRPLVQKIQGMIKEETEYITKRVHHLTSGEIRSPKQRDVTLKWLKKNGTFLPNLQRKTVEEALASGLAKGKSKELLGYRLSASKTSTAKYESFERRSGSDGRARDILFYHAASTGRWGGVGIQPQNLPRPHIKEIHQACDIIRESDLETVRMIYGSPMDVFSSCLRGMIIAPPGKVLDVADYSAIEARVLFWVAGHEMGLEAYRQGRDLYKELAAKIFSIKEAEVTPEHRFVGKQATLGCGYSMSWKKFIQTCKNFGKDIPDETAQKAVHTYRTVHRPVVKLWSNIERAAHYAVENPGKKVSINHTKWWVKGGFLWCGLPSGRRLAYYGPEIISEFNTWKDKVPVLYHWGVDPKTKKWTKAKTYGGKLVENVVQAISRDIMAEAMLRIDSRDWDIILSVHDELIAERSSSEFNNLRHDEFCKLMAQPPKWATDCPIAVEGWYSKRYKK